MQNIAFRAPLKTTTLQQPGRGLAQGEILVMLHIECLNYISEVLKSTDCEH
jgi:hypothetical protein